MQLEAEATARAICLASFVNTPLYVVHVMSIDAMEEIAKAQKRGFYFTLSILSDEYRIQICIQPEPHFFFFFVFTGQKVIGEPVLSGLVLDDSKLWDPDFITAAKQVPYYFSISRCFFRIKILSF